MLLRTHTLALLTLACAALLGPAAANAGSFQVNCRLSHSATDDPIVHPGHAGMAHRHDFYGSRSTRAGSTWTSMVRSRSSCSDHTDTAGYWQPSLFVGDTPLRGNVVAYYSRGGKSTVVPYPRDLRVIAGSASAPAAQSRRFVFWYCANAPRRVRSALPPRCATGQRLAVQVNFPDCWNGRDLDSADHRSHMAYSRAGRCPATHRRPLPRLEMRITWPARPRTSQVTLASGGAHTMHADFWNAWNQPRLRSLVNRCLNQATTCGTVTKS